MATWRGGPDKPHKQRLGGGGGAEPPRGPLWSVVGLGFRV